MTTNGTSNTGYRIVTQNDMYILADDMGLGKTTSMYLRIMKQQRTLIVCPIFKLIGREIENYTNEEVVIIEVKMERGKFIIINYDILKNFHSFKDDSIRTLLDSE